MVSKVRNSLTPLLGAIVLWALTTALWEVVIWTVLKGQEDSFIYWAVFSVYLGVAIINGLTLGFGIFTKGVARDGSTSK